MKNTALGLLALPLLMLGACSVKPSRLEVVPLLPPLVHLEPCPETPIPESGTNGDLLQVAAMLRLDLAHCNAQLTILREWRKEHETMGREK